MFAYCILLSGALLLVFALGPDEPGKGSLCAFFGLILLACAYLLGKALIYRVEVRGESITVHNLLRKPYTVTFRQIVSVKRRGGKGQWGQGRLTIRTDAGQKLVVEGAEVYYWRLAERIRAEVRPDRLTGFE